MSRYAALNLANLPPLSAVTPLSFEAILEARLVELEQQLTVRFEPAKVTELMALARSIAASPMRYLNETAAARELYIENRINTAVKSIFLATAIGTDLDHLGANRGVARRILDDSDPDDIIYETDEDFRARIQLSLEAFSPHGTEGSYVYWALDADDRVRDVVAYGPNHNVVPAVLPAHVRVVVLSRDGDGTAPQDLLDAVYANLIPDKRRPVSDKIEVVSAAPAPYRIVATLHVASSEAVSAVLAAAQAGIAEFINSRLRIGRKVYRSTIASILRVDGVVDVEIAEPAADIVIDASAAPYCTEIVLSTSVISGGWASV